MRSSFKKVLRWLIPLMVVFLFGGVFLGVKASQMFSSPVGATSQYHNTQVINAVTRTEEVSLLSLGIQGIAEKTGKTTVFGVEVPGSERATFIQYTFSAKLGFDGKDVKIEERGTNQYTISIPEFVFIGHDDVDLKLVTEKNGVLSWTNPKIDTLEMANHILNDKAQDGYIDSNEAVLKDEAKAYYNGIVKGIDPTIDLDFKFA